MLIYPQSLWVALILYPFTLTKPFQECYLRFLRTALRFGKAGLLYPFGFKGKGQHRENVS